MQDDNRKNLFPDLEEETIEEEQVTQETNDGNEETNKKNSISADLIRGHINTIILRALYEGDRYGYDIISEIEQKSHGQYTLKQPTLYSALKRLEKQGYVKSYWGGVSNGGRRRYFSLTEEGREIAEKNQAEWEYSRTIIDSLISEKDFDFSQPVPEKLDFRILRQATSRTPIVDELDAESYTTVVLNAPQSEEQPIIKKAETETKTTANVTTPIEDVVTPVVLSIETPQQPVQEQKVNTAEEQPLPLYITRTEEERNYKDILARIYRSGMKTEKNNVQESVATTTAQVNEPTQEKVIYVEQQDSPVETVKTQEYKTEPAVQYYEPTRPLTPGRIDFQDVEEQARYDGLRVWTAGGATTKKEMPENFFNKGFALLKASLVFFAIAILETIFVVLFKDTFNIGMRYTAIMLFIACAPPVVCAALYFAKYQPCCKRLKNNASIYNGVVAFIAAFILLVAVDLIMDVNLTQPMVVVKYLVIPLIYLLNIIVFATTYYFLSRSKV